MGTKQALVEVLTVLQIEGKLRINSHHTERIASNCNPTKGPANSVANIRKIFSHNRQY